jgi:ABC-type multidrug transport system ATPase subunit
VAREIDIWLNPREALALTGPNGSGKTTLLWTLCGGIRPMSGKLHAVGEDLTRPRGRRRIHRAGAIRVVLQQGEANVLRGTLREELHSVGARVEDVGLALKKAGLLDRLDYSPHALSVGELKLFCLAAACAAGPPLLLLDEPTAALDRKLVPLAIEMIRATLKRGSAVVVATHDLRLLQAETLFTHHLDLSI